MRTFDHMGVPTTQKQPKERYVQRTHVWVTDPHEHPFAVEFLRYEPDSPSPQVLKEQCHIAFHVDSIAEESKGLTVLQEPFASVAGHVVGFYLTPDGVPVELMEF